MSWNVCGDEREGVADDMVVGVNVEVGMLVVRERRGEMVL